MHKIFISYSRADYSKVLVLKNEIEEVTGQGSCWIDLSGIESDRQFVDVIIEAIDKAEIFLFIYSKHSERSEWTRKEIEYAYSEKKRIVFVKMGNIQLSKYFRFQFGGHDIIDINDGKQKRKLLKNLAEWCNVAGNLKPKETRQSSISNLWKKLLGYFEGCPGKKGMSLKEYQKKAIQGDRTAQSYIGCCYFYGRFGLTTNYEKEVEWFGRAAMQGDAFAQSNLGYCYDQGLGVERNYREAVKWYHKAATQGEPYAQFNLGASYYWGRGVPRNYEEAVKWYRMAAKQGHEPALKALEAGNHNAALPNH